MADHLITGYGALLDNHGRLREPGFALEPPFAYDRNAITAPASHVREWDRYLVGDGSVAVLLGIWDMGLVGLVSASVTDLATGWHATADELVPMPLGRMGLPLASDTGDVAWHSLRTSVSFRHTETGRRLSLSMLRFDDRDDLEVEVLLDREPRDSMVTCVPWDGDPEAFLYGRVVIGMRARGALRVGATFHEIGPADGSSGEAFGTLDWGRGAWADGAERSQLVAQGRQGGHTVGLGLVRGPGDASELAGGNAILVDGVAHRLGRVGLEVPEGRGGAGRRGTPWRVSDDEGRLDLVLEPDLERSDPVGVAGLVLADRHRTYGRLSGAVVLDDGSELVIDGLRGLLEHVRGRL